MTGGMMFKGTPGPWYASDWGADNGEDKFTIEVRYPEILRPGQSSIWPDGVSKHQVASTEEAIFDRDTNLANANLIAAAPELLEALTDLVQAIEYTPMGVRGIFALENAKKTITKSLGK